MESTYKGVFKKGISKGKISVYYEDIKMSPEDISKKMNEPLDVVNKVIQKLKK